MIIVGLTGSIGMGKSTVAGFFAKAGIPVYSADTAVHVLYRQKPVIDKIAAVFPEVVEDGAINHQKLAAVVFNRPEALKKLEAVIHPLVRAAEAAFVEEAHRQGNRLVILEVPLLYETGGPERFDKVIVVSAPEKIQRKRVLSRPGMTEEKLAGIRARQMPDEEKRRRADFVIDTGKGYEETRKTVHAILQALLSPTGGTN